MSAAVQYVAWMIPVGAGVTFVETGSVLAALVCALGLPLVAVLDSRGLIR